MPQIPFDFTPNVRPDVPYEPPVLPASWGHEIFQGQMAMGQAAQGVAQAGTELATKEYRKQRNLAISAELASFDAERNDIRFQALKLAEKETDPERLNQIYDEAKARLDEVRQQYTKPETRIAIDNAAPSWNQELSAALEARAVALERKKIIASSLTAKELNMRHGSVDGVVEACRRIGAAEGQPEEVVQRDIAAALTAMSEMQARNAIADFAAGQYGTDEEVDAASNRIKRDLSGQPVYSYLTKEMLESQKKEVDRVTKDQKREILAAWNKQNVEVSDSIGADVRNLTTEMNQVSAAKPIGLMERIGQAGMLGGWVGKKAMLQTRISDALEAKSISKEQAAEWNGKLEHAAILRAKTIEEQTTSVNLAADESTKAAANHCINQLARDEITPDQAISTLNGLYKQAKSTGTASFLDERITLADGAKKKETATAVQEARKTAANEIGRYFNLNYFGNRTIDPLSGDDVTDKNRAREIAEIQDDGDLTPEEKILQVADLNKKYLEADRRYNNFVRSVDIWVNDRLKSGKPPSVEDVKEHLRKLMADPLMDAMLGYRLQAYIERQSLGLKGRIPRELLQPAEIKRREPASSAREAKPPVTASETPFHPSYPWARSWPGRTEPTAAEEKK